MMGEDATGLLSALPSRISDIFKPWAEQSPDRPAVVEASGAWTYRQLATAVADARIWLEGLGVRPGDRVMVVCENCRPLVAILLALASMDAWAVLVNARLAAREIDEIRDHCGARRVIFTTRVSAKQESMPSGTGQPQDAVATHRQCVRNIRPRSPLSPRTTLCIWQHAGLPASFRLCFGLVSRGNVSSSRRDRSS